MKINSTNNTSFGIKIVKTNAYKNILKVLESQFPKAEIKMRLTKLKKSANNDYFIKIDTFGKNKQLKAEITSIYDVPKTYKFKTTFIDKKTGKTLHYTPKFIVRKLIAFVKQYKNGCKNSQPYYIDNLVNTVREKNRLLF